MGLFNKIKNILFEADEEIEEMPVYTKEEKNIVKDEPIVSEVPKIEEDLINNSDSSYFSNIKRDIDYSYDEVDVLAEVPGARTVTNNTYEEPAVSEELVQPEEKKSPFLTFDEDEFERLNSRITKNEDRIRKDRDTSININAARKSNGNFSATSTPDKDRYVGSTSKKFTPSLVISPVYGVLNKNYTKEDIVDKKDGMKREIVKPIVRKEIIKEDPVELVKIKEEKVDIDSVRKKAFGNNNVKSELSIDDIDDVVNVKEKTSRMDVYENKKTEQIITVEDELELEFPKTVDVVESIEEIEDFKVLDTEEDSSIIHDESIDVIDEILKENDEFHEEINDIHEENLIEDLPFIKGNDQIVDDNLGDTEIVDEKKNKIDKSKILNDLEKTSTLQILDDIERELNSIKPITENYSSEVEEEKEKIERNDTLENDLFNLIDSMYEEGEEEEDD